MELHGGLPDRNGELDEAFCQWEGLGREDGRRIALPATTGTKLFLLTARGTLDREERRRPKGIRVEVRTRRTLPMRAPAAISPKNLADHAPHRVGSLHPRTLATTSSKSLVRQDAPLDLAREGCLYVRQFGCTSYPLAVRRGSACGMLLASLQPPGANLRNGPSIRSFFGLADLHVYFLRFRGRLQTLRLLDTRITPSSTSGTSSPSSSSAGARVIILPTLVSRGREEIGKPRYDGWILRLLGWMLDGNGIWIYL